MLRNNLRLYNVVHEHFCTDHLAFVETLFMARSAKEAGEKYDKLQKKRSEYPYMWSKHRTVYRADVNE